MLILIKIILAIFFVISGGALFKKTFKNHKVLYMLASFVILVMALYFIKDVYDDLTAVFSESPSDTDKQTSQQKRKNSKETTLVGCWQWPAGHHLTVKTNGIANAKNFAFDGEWKSTNSFKRQYRIVWPEAIYRMQLSKNGKILKGANQFSIPLTAIRKSGKSKTEPTGSWTWGAGIVVNILPNHTIQSNDIKGKWHKTDDIYYINWPSIDKVTISKDGSKLSGVNSLGFASSAIRDVNCKN